MFFVKLGFLDSIGPVWSQWTRWSPCNINCTTKRQRYCFRRNSTECPGANRNYIQIASKPCNCVGKYAAFAHMNSFSLYVTFLSDSFRNNI